MKSDVHLKDFSHINVEQTIGNICEMESLNVCYNMHLYIEFVFVGDLDMHTNMFVLKDFDMIWLIDIG